MQTRQPPVQFTAPTQRLDAIARARNALLSGLGKDTSMRLPLWLARSWERCLALGLQPDRAAHFDLHSPEHVRRVLDANQSLVQTARPILENLGRAIADTGYFAILTNRDGMVVDVSGPIDRSDRRADLITRIGTDLSEGRVGTTAIGTALTERQPVWLHRGEHFFANTTAYSCAGAPLTGPDVACAGMLDVTGIDAVERPELRHLVTQVAGKIENALVLAREHALTIRLNWPGNAMGSDADGLLCLDADGWITGANQSARQMVPNLPAEGQSLHVGDLLGVPDSLSADESSGALFLYRPADGSLAGYRWGIEVKEALLAKESA
jgi:transcriptional regulator of acetoin/glycerol metabolism